VLRTAVKLSEPVWHALKIEVNLDIQSGLPPVLGDSNQLLQVCVQVLANAANNADQHEADCVSVSAAEENGLAVITVSENPLPARKVLEEESGDSAIPPMCSLGLTACQGILQQHKGKICWVLRRDRGIEIRIEIPVIAAGLEKSSPAAVPVMWQAQPSA